MHRHWNLPAPPSRARVGVRLQPAPAAASTSSRLACRSRSSPMRAGAPPSHQDRGVRNPRVLALIGACDAVLRCSLGTARGPLIGVKVLAGLDGRRSKGQNVDVCAKVGLLAISLSPHQPFPSGPIFGQGVASGCQSCHGKERGAGRQMHCATRTPVPLRSTTMYRVSGLSRHSSPEPRNPERKTNRPYLDCCYMRKTSRTARTNGVFHNRPSLQGNLLRRSEWLRLQGIAETDCMILPVRGLAAFPPRTVSEQLKAGERSAPWSLPTPELLDDFRWQSDPLPCFGSLGRADSPLFEAHRQYQRLRFGSLEIASGSGGRMVPTEARSPKDLLSVGQNNSGLSINLTLIPVRDALSSSVPAAFWLSLPIREGFE